MKYYDALFDFEDSRKKDLLRKDLNREQLAALVAAYESLSIRLIADREDEDAWSDLFDQLDVFNPVIQSGFIEGGMDIGEPYKDGGANHAND